ncbi:recombinase RarA, partial [Enterococcus faecalis]
LIMIGPTTENPNITIKPAIRCRTQIFEVNPLTETDFQQAIQEALTDSTRGLGYYPDHFEEKALQHLTRATNGDLRSALNGL